MSDGELHIQTDYDFILGAVTLPIRPPGHAPTKPTLTEGGTLQPPVASASPHHALSLAPHLPSSPAVIVAMISGYCTSQFV